MRGSRIINGDLHTTLWRSAKQTNCEYQQPQRIHGPVWLSHSRTQPYTRVTKTIV